MLCSQFRCSCRSSFIHTTIQCLTSLQAPHVPLHSLLVSISIVSRRPYFISSSINILLKCLVLPKRPLEGWKLPLEHLYTNITQILTALGDRSCNHPTLFGRSGPYHHHPQSARIWPSYCCGSTLTVVNISLISSVVKKMQTAHNM